VFLILDRLKAHRARLTREWLAEHRSAIEVFYLPPHGPELNPDEGVNADLKQAVPRKAPARSRQQLRRATISHMRSLSKRPQRIRAIFQHQQFRYAA
ncbi:MAG: transposase, partial [Acetobacteraceae bacterium]|nr:transposase [Acetobacteraceae bacterium]